MTPDDLLFWNLGTYGIASTHYFLVGVPLEQCLPAQNILEAEANVKDVSTVQLNKW